MNKNRLYLGNLAYTMTDDDIKDKLSEFGTVISVKLFADKGYGFAEMATEEAAERVVQELNGQEIKGRPLRVDIAKPPTPREDRPSFDRSGPSRFSRDDKPRRY